MNLQVSDKDWLILQLDTTPRRVGLTAITQLRWEGDRPEVLDAELLTPTETYRRRRRDRAQAVRRLAERWDGNLPSPPVSNDPELSRAGFVLARKLLGRAFLAQLTPDDKGELDVAVTVTSEDLDTVLRRMEGRCRPESMIARLRKRFGVTFFDLFRTTHT